MLRPEGLEDLHATHEAAHQDSRSFRDRALQLLAARAGVLTALGPARLR